MPECRSVADVAWNEAERRTWLFPPVRGEWDGFQLEYLDPSDPDDRSILIGCEHPELWRALERGQEETKVDGVEVSPRMHLTLHEVIANQIWDGDPPIAGRTAERPTGLGYDRHEVLHMLAGVMSVEIRKSLQQRRPHDPVGYAEALSALPESRGSEPRRRGRHDH
jgi:hypothetical protein